MRRDRQFSPTTHLMLGTILAVLGILFTLDNLHVLHAREVLRFWPVALIAVGLVQIAQSRAPGGWIGGGIWIFIGSLLLANRLGWVHANIWDYWPLFLVLFGGRMIAQALYGQCSTDGTEANPVGSGVAILGRWDRKVTSHEFQRAEVTAFLGGGRLDLRDAALAGGTAVVHVVAMMGGFEILVPRDWNVINEMTPIMGGVDDRRRASPAAPDAPRLILRGVVLMGGVEIKD